MVTMAIAVCAFEQNAESICILWHPFWHPQRCRCITYMPGCGGFACLPPCCSVMIPTRWTASCVYVKCIGPLQPSLIGMGVQSWLNPARLRQDRAEMANCNLHAPWAPIARAAVSGCNMRAFAVHAASTAITLTHSEQCSAQCVLRCCAVQQPE
jgi:hypothetical protein